MTSSIPPKLQEEGLSQLCAAIFFQLAVSRSKPGTFCMQVECSATKLRVFRRAQHTKLPISKDLSVSDYCHALRTRAGNLQPMDPRSHLPAKVIQPMWSLAWEAKRPTQCALCWMGTVQVQGGDTLSVWPRQTEWEDLRSHIWVTWQPGAMTYFSQMKSAHAHSKMALL